MPHGWPSISPRRRLVCARQVRPSWEHIGLGNGGWYDRAEAAAITLTNEGHTGNTYAITGTEALSPNDVADLYSDLSGSP